MSSQNDFLSLIGRILLGLMFFIGGIGKVTGYAGTVAYATKAGLPMPDISVGIGAAIEIIAPLMLLVGFKVRWAALALIVFTLVATFFFHNYWTMEGAARMTNQITLLKNLAVVGGLLMLIVAGPGRYSMDARR